MRDKIPVNARIEPELIERLRNAVWWIGRGLTIQALIEEALESIAGTLEAKYNRGKPFPQRETELPKSPKTRRKKKA